MGKQISYYSPKRSPQVRLFKVIFSHPEISNGFIEPASHTCRRNNSGGNQGSVCFAVSPCQKQILKLE